MDNSNSLNIMLADSIKANWERKALADYNGKTYTYGQVARQIVRNHILFDRHGVRPGDKVAICGRNRANWAMSFLSVMTYGLVAVPLLHEFRPDSLHTLIAHSEARILFVDKQIWERLDIRRMPVVETVVCIDDYSIVYSSNMEVSADLNAVHTIFSRKYPGGITPGDVRYHDDRPEQLALINYTSGSTGKSKGVMLSYRNLWSNIRFAHDHMPYMHAGDGIVSMLPLAHMYGLIVEFLFPFSKGATVTFLGRVPSPTILLGAFAQVHPKLIITVPLVIEKIIKNKVFPLLRKPVIRAALAIPGIKTLLYRRLRRKLLDVFGGNLFELIIGGAALNHDVESLLRRIRFPFTVGFGMTECAPLIAYAQWDATAPGACGRIVDRMQWRIDSSDPVNVPGVLYVRGDNVMQGYYRNPDATREALSDDGWLCTGDICTVDDTGLLYIRGRDKNMILGPSGQNIYPEEIEAVLSELPYVLECVVVDRDHQIHALVYSDRESAAHDGLDDAGLRRVMDGNLSDLNRRLPAYSRVKAIELRDEPFEKTPKHSIRRFLYK